MGNNFKFLSPNFVVGSSQLSASSGTVTLGNLLDRDKDTQWISSVQGTDGTAASFTWTPAAPATLNRIFLKNHNFAAYKIYYNGTESNVFNPAISQTGNLSVNSYHEFASQAVTSVTIKATHTISANSEKACGEYACGTEIFEAAANPAEYTPILRKKGYDLEMADGGVRSIWLGKKFHADLAFNYVGTGEQVKFENLYNTHANFYFMPTPVSTGTGWDGDAWLVNWIADEDDMKLTGGIGTSAGYDVNMSLWEVTG